MAALTPSRDYYVTKSVAANVVREYFAQSSEPVYFADDLVDNRAEAWNTLEQRMSPSVGKSKAAFYVAFDKIHKAHPELFPLLREMEDGASGWATSREDMVFLLGRAVGEHEHASKNA